MPEEEAGLADKGWSTIPPKKAPAKLRPNENVPENGQMPNGEARGRGRTSSTGTRRREPSRPGRAGRGRGEPAHDMDSLREKVANAVAGTGDVRAAIVACTFQPREAAFTTLIHQCTRAKAWQKALEVFEVLSETRGVQPNTICYSAVISACSSAGRWQEAEQLFQRMLVAAQSSPECEPNTITYSSLISACERGGRLDRALEWFDKMKTAGVEADLITFRSVAAPAVATCGRASACTGQRACGLPQDRTAEKCSPISLAVLLWTSHSAGWGDVGVAFQRRPRNAEVFPTSLILPVGWGELRAWSARQIRKAAQGKAGRALTREASCPCGWRCGRFVPMGPCELFTEVRCASALSVSPKSLLCARSALISACERNVEVDMALKLLDDAQQAGHLAPTETYARLIEHCGRRRNCELALELFLGLQMAGGEASRSVVLALFGAFESCSRARQAAQLLEAYQDAGHPVDASIVAAVLRVYAKVGSWQRAVALSAERFRLPGIKPDSTLAQLVVDACLKGDNKAKASELQEVFRREGILTGSPAGSVALR